MRLTKIIATVGPASSDPRVLAELIEEGVRLFRINFSHGSFDDFARYVRHIREASEIVNRPIGILGDLSGPKIRIVADIEGGQLHLEDGEEVQILESTGPTRRDPDTGQALLSTTYPPLPREVEPGQRVFIDDGQVRLLAVERIDSQGGPRLVCTVTRGGPVLPKKGLNLPDTDLSMPSLTEYDHACVRWTVEHDLDYLALSFVRRGGDLTRLRELLAAEGRKDLPIVAKLETPQALDDLEAVVEEADALMVARGDLGVEMDLAEVPVWQKRIIRQAHDFGKPVIVATQMLQSMIEQAGPTRAEVSDVANAVLDGADALMLSGETAIGAYAVQSVQVMTRSTRVAEAEAFRLRSGEPRPPANLRHRRYRSAALAHGVSVVVEDLEARYVVVWTEHGGGARYLSQNRLAVPIIALSQSVPALRQMGLNFGVYPVYMDRPESAAQLLERADCLMLDSGWAERGDAIVAALGEPLGTAGVTNEIRVHYVGDACRR